MGGGGVHCLDSRISNVMGGGGHCLDSRISNVMGGGGFTAWIVEYLM